MRKPVAILLTLVLLFNLCGYRFLIAALQTKADTRLETAIDNKEYSDAELIELRVTMNMPYQSRYTDFERHYGEITIDGKFYTYVERKIEGDVLILKCIANQSKQQLKSAVNDLVQSNSAQDQDNSAKKQANSFAKVFSGDFEDKNQFCSLSLNDIHHFSLTAVYSSALNDVIINTPHQPPRVA